MLMLMSYYTFFLQVEFFSSHLTTAGNISSKHEVQSPDWFQVNLPESICQHQSCLM